MTLQQLENKVKILEGRLCCGKPMFYPTFVDFPATGKDNTLYVDEETGAIYIWNGSEYITAEGGGGIDRFHTNIVGTAPYDPLLPLTGWVAPSSPIAGNTVEVKFTDGTIGNYTFDGTVWWLDFVDEWFEKRICLNTATPTFTPSNLLMPTVAEVQAWTLANVAEKDRLNGTHVVYFIAGQGGDCENPDYTWVLNKGSELVTRTQNSILTLPNYTALRTLTKYNHDIVIVDDWTYTGPDGNTYTTLGGIFKRIHDRTITENGGTIIVTTNGDIWERDWDNIHVQPEWWECGGYDKFGNNYTSKNTLSLVSNTTFGSVGTHHNGVYNDRDRIQNAIYMGTDTKDIIVEYQAREYIIDKALSNYHPLGVGYNISGEHRFNYAIIKRIDSPVTTLAANLTASATTITVTSAAGFRVGQNLSVFSSGSPFGGLGFDEAAFLLITGISGNVITVSNGTPSKTFSIGATVMLEVTLFDNRIYTGKSIKYSNAFFDGNKLNGGGQRYPQDWRYNYVISSGTSANSVIFENIEFKDNPGENVTAPTGYMINCRGYNLDGSFLHYSMSDAAYALGRMTGMIIDGCFVDGVCLSTDAVSNHNEAVITNSLHTEFIKLTNSTFKNGAEYIFGPDPEQPDTKMNFQITNNHFENFKHICIASSGSSQIPARESGMTIIGNTFINCGDFMLGAYGAFNENNIYKGKSWDNIVIADNVFIGSRFIFHSCTNLNFTNNQVLFRDETASTYPDYGFPDIDINPQRAAIFLMRCAKVNISENIVENQKTEHEKLMIGISFPAQYHTRMKDISGTETNFYYEQGVKIDNNKVLGFHSGINCVIGPNQILENISKPNYGSIGWSVSNNVIVLSGETPTYNTRYWGIGVCSGVIVKNNTIYQLRNNNDQAGIFACNSFFFPDVTSTILGAIVEQNLIYGHPSSTGPDITVGVFGNGWHNYNCVVRDNLYVRNLDGSNVARNYFNNNIDLLTTLTAWTSPNVPVFQTFEWNKSNY